MKKFNLLVLGAALLFVFKTSAQDNKTDKVKPMFGLRAGYSSLDLKVSVNGDSESEDISGFYIGGFVDIFISEKFNIQPELTYANYSEDGESRQYC